jgi:hypothetical protein
MAREDPDTRAHVSVYTDEFQLLVPRRARQTNHGIRTKSATEETAGSKAMNLCKITKEA